MRWLWFLFVDSNLYPCGWDSTENALIEEAYLGRLWPYSVER